MSNHLPFCRTMTDIASLFPTQSQASLAKCGQCSLPVTFALRGDKGPIHDPITGDMVCGKCKQPHLQRSRTNRPLPSRDVVALPLYMLRAIKSVATRNAPSTSKSVEEKGLEQLKSGKCFYHEGVTWNWIDLDENACLCDGCHIGLPDHNYAILDGGVQYVRISLANILSMSIYRKMPKPGASPDATLMDGDEQKCALGMQQEDSNLIQVANDMDKTGEILSKLMNDVMESCVLLYHKIEQVKSILNETDTNHLEQIIQGRDRQYHDACQVYIQSLYPMIRVRQVISGTLLEGLKILGLTSIDPSKSTIRKYILDALLARDETRPMGFEEVVVLRCLICLKETLMKGDPLLIEMTEEKVMKVLDQPDGLHHALTMLTTKLNKVCVDVPSEQKMSEVILDEMKSVFVEVSRVIPLLLHPQPEYWKTCIKAVTETPTSDEIINTIWNALFYKDEDDNKRVINHHTLKIINNLKKSLSEADGLLIEGILGLYFDRDCNKYFIESEKKGCHHPLLYHYLGRIYCLGQEDVVTDHNKAIEYFTKAVAGRLSLLFYHLLIHNILTQTFIPCLSISLYVLIYSLYIYICIYVYIIYMYIIYISILLYVFIYTIYPFFFVFIYILSEYIRCFVIIAGSMLGCYDYHWGLYRGYEKQFESLEQGREFYLELERQGCVDGHLFYMIGTLTYGDYDLLFGYYWKGADLGSVPAYRVLSYRRWTGGWGTGPRRDKSLVVLLKAEERGIRDDTILDRLLERLCNRGYKPGPDVLGPFGNRRDMAMHYCEVLKNRHSPYGYYWKGLMFWYGLAEMPQDKQIAINLWLSADKQGLASYDLYMKERMGLIQAYR